MKSGAVDRGLFPSLVSFVVGVECCERAFFSHQHFVHLLRPIAKFNLSLTQGRAITLAGAWAGGTQYGVMERSQN